MWIDTHCHLDAPEFSRDVSQVRQAARAAGVEHCVIPAVERANWSTVRALAHRFEDSYCLGIHPLYVPQAGPDDLQALGEALQTCRDDPRLVAVGEIGLDFFVPSLMAADMREKQEFFYRQQLLLARRFNLPVVLHVRRSADRLLKHLREVGPCHTWRGIAHAFNGSDVQANAFVALGFKLGFGGAVTFERALQLQRLARNLPGGSLVLETDAPDIPPHWLYTTAQERAAGARQGRNTPAELPAIGARIARLRETDPPAIAELTRGNAIDGLPGLRALLV